MTSLFQKFYHHTLVGNIFRTMYHKIPYYLPDRGYVKFRYWTKYGKALNLKKPNTLNEKINWLKLYDRTPLHTQCADKYAVREYVTQKIGAEYLVPLFYQNKNIEEINAKNIVQTPCIIKTNHDSGGGVFVYNIESIDWPKLRNDLELRLEKNYYNKTREWQYKHVEPRIIVEKLLLDQEGNIPMDYKIHCFNGKPEIIQVDFDRFSNHKRNLYDTDWNLLPFTWSMWANQKPLWSNGKEMPKPDNLNRILKLAEALSSDFIFARIDFYEVGRRIYFGEITFHPGSGFEVIFPEKWNRELGQRLKLPFESTGDSE